MTANMFGAEAPQRKRGKIAKGLGWDALADATSRVAGTASDAAGRVGWLTRSVFARNQEGVAIPQDAKDPGERFLAAMRLNRRTEADLRAMQRNTWRGFYLYTVLLNVALVAGIASLKYAPIGGLAPLDAAFRFVLVPLLLAMALKWGYVNWIVRRRRLDGFGAYLVSGQWFPVATGSRPDSGERRA